MNRFVLFTASIAVLLNHACERRTPETARTTGNASDRAPTAANSEPAYVRFINADPTRPSLDLYFGDTKAFSQISYRQVSGFQTLPTERAQFRARLSSASTDLATNSEGLWAGKYYTIVALPKGGGETTLNAISEGFDAPAAGKAKVRVINAAMDTGDVDLWVTGGAKELLDGVDPNSASSFEEVDPVSGTVEIRRDDRTGMAARVPDMTLQAGRLYTVLVTGDRNRLQAMAIEETTGMTAQR